jgi:hypothetical protein
LIYFTKETEMIFQNATRVIMALAVTTALAQGTPPAAAGSPQAAVPGGNDVMQRQGYAGRRAPSAKQPRGVPVQTSLRERVQDMERTLTQMRLVLTKMHDKAAKSKTQDSLAKANLDMWELMVSHLDKELRELKDAAAAREDMEARLQAGGCESGSRGSGGAGRWGGQICCRSTSTGRAGCGTKSCRTDCSWSAFPCSSGK